MTFLPIWGYVVLSIGVALVSAGITWMFSRIRVMAPPNGRSAHKVPTPTAGGLGPAVAILGGITVLSALGAASPSLVTLTGLCGLLTMLGFIDDLLDFSLRWKFLLIAILSIAIAALLGPVRQIPFDNWFLDLPWMVGIAGTALWAFVVINGVNFMDGADGVIPLSAFMAATGLLVLSLLFHEPRAAVSATLLLGALAGFIPFNAPKARIFLGDTGSLFIGGWLAGTALILIERGPEPALWLMPLLLMPWLSDVLLTMAWRLYKGQNMLTAHNSHLYQLALAKGRSHFQVALGLSLQMLACLVLALIFQNSATSSFYGFAAAASFALVVHLIARFRDL